MKVIDVHPEDLFDKEEKQTLTTDERTRLDAHLAACSVCRFERAARADFQSELSSDRRGLDELVAGALKGPKTESSRSEDEVVLAARPHRKTRRRAALVLAAAAVFATGIAAAETGAAHHAWNFARQQVSLIFGSSSEAEIVEPTSGHKPAKEESRRAKEEDPASARAPEPASVDPTPSIEQPAASEPSASPAPPGPSIGSRAQASPATAAPSVARASQTGSQAASARPQTSLSTPAAAQASSAHVDLEPPRPAAKVEESAVDKTPSAPDNARVQGAADLFDRASSARRQGRLDEAIVLYRELGTRHPESAEARLSHAVVGRLELDRGNNATALAEFEAYLASGDRMLREEAMAGRAMVLGRLGRTADAADAWRTLLSAFPQSSYAPLAERQLGAR